MPDVWTIYCHTHIATGRRYVGLTKQTWQQRWVGHVGDARRHAKGWGHFPNALRLYGPAAFSHEVLETCATLEAARQAETKWIGRYETRNKAKGFNYLPGGESPAPPDGYPWGRPEYKAAHLEASRANIARARAHIQGPPRRNQTHCKNGHEFTPENTALNRAPSRKGRGVSRICRQCKRDEEKRAGRVRVRVLTASQKARKTALQKARRAK